jgi:hypothetical protein
MNLSLLKIKFLSLLSSSLLKVNLPCHDMAGKFAELALNNNQSLTGNKNMKCHFSKVFKLSV